jgi:hypothetical protein
MSMIDWYSVGLGALWIMGLGLVTAGLSLANFIGCTQICKFGQALKMPACRMMIGLGLVLFCLGLAGSVSTLWEHLLWAVLALIFALQSWRMRKISNQ